MNNIIKLENIEKSFPGVKALQGVSFSVNSGEVHALVGENGAGKSTLIKTLMGVYQKDAGKIYYKGDEVHITSPLKSKEIGLAAVYQDISLARHLTVGENFFLGSLPKKNGVFVDWIKTYEESQRVLDELGIEIDSRKRLDELSVAQQEMVAIAKAVHEKAEVLIFDEPTALLANEECEILFELIRRLQKSGKGIIYISHRMEEIFHLSNRITILKDGQYIDTINTSETNEEEIIALMVGRDVGDMYNITQYVREEEAIRVENFNDEKKFHNINFHVKKGEIFGMFGLVGSGRTEIVNAIFGAEPRTSGRIFINGRETEIRSPKEAIKNGIGFATEDRKHLSIAMPLDIKINTNIASYESIRSFGIIDEKAERDVAETYVKKLRTKTPSIDQKIKNLSGGNQQKVVISKWLARKSDIFIFDEPTIGVDVGAKKEIYKIFEELLEQGAAIILISSYLPEVMGLSNRMAVIHEGNCAGVVDPKTSSEEEILKLASGIY